jgi:hypothetical protein
MLGPLTPSNFCACGSVLYAEPQGCRGVALRCQEVCNLFRDLAPWMNLHKNRNCDSLWIINVAIYI